MNILLINPWITDFAAYDFWVKPLGLLYVGAFLKKRGHNVRLVDCMDRFQDGSGVKINNSAKKYNTGKFHREIIKKPECQKHIPRHFCRYGIPLKFFQELVFKGWKPDIVLVSSIMTYWYHGVFEVVLQLRKLLPDVPVILGGIYAILCKEHARKYSDVDVVITDPSPSNMIDIVESFGVSKSDGPIVSEHFNEWPEPLWDLYSTLKTAMVLTTRGCPMNCTVCSSKILFDGYERRDPVKAAYSIIDLARRGVQDIAFGDDAILIDTENHAALLFETLAREKSPVRLHSPNGLHIREITPEIAHLMKQAGMVTIRLSLETASEKRAKDFSNKVSRDEFKTAVEALFHVGYTSDDIGAYILVGLPGQTMDEVGDTIEFVIETGVKVRPALYSPVPHTVEFERAVQVGMIKMDDDPVLHNNTLRTVDWFEGGNEGYKEFTRLVNMANEMAGRGHKSRN